MKILHFTGHCINRFCTVTWYAVVQTTDFSRFLCTVACIKYMLLPYLYDKPQRQLTLNHIESKCYRPYNLLPEVDDVSILPIPVSPLNMRGPRPLRLTNWMGCLVPLRQNCWYFIAGLECHVKFMSLKFRGRVLIWLKLLTGILNLI